MNNVRKFDRIRKDAEAVDRAAGERRTRQSPKGNRSDAEPPALGASLLDEVRQFLCRFIAYPSDHAAVAHTLWICHTHTMDAWESTPRLAFLSPEPASGKTRALEVTERLVHNPLLAVNVSVSYVFRKMADPTMPATLLHDEIDAVFRKAGDNEQLRALLNAGHRRGAVVGRCVMVRNKPQLVESSAFGAVALAGLGHLPDTIRTRSIVIRMRKRSRGERVQPFRQRDVEPESSALRERVVAWMATKRAELTHARPLMPPGVEDRDADTWEALLAIAEAAGGSWPILARLAAVALVSQAKQSIPSLGVLLLRHIRSLFVASSEAQLPTAVMLEGLRAMEEAPWHSLRGEPLDSRYLAKLLSEYEIRSHDMRTGEGVRKGYRRCDFEEAWSRYLLEPSDGAGLVATTATSATSATATLGPAKPSTLSPPTG
jgi:hypothetical protein